MTQERCMRHQDVRCFNTYSMDVICCFCSGETAQLGEAASFFGFLSRTQLDTHIPTLKSLDLHLKQPVLAFCRQVA